MSSKVLVVKARNFNEYFDIKDQWVSLDKPNMDSRPELYGEVASVMNTAYAPVGGHAKYRNKEDLEGEDKHSRYDMVDNDKDPYVDAAKVYSETDHGFKASLSGHDDGEGKEAAKEYSEWAYKQPGHYTEASGPMANFLNRVETPMVTGEEDISAILGDKRHEIKDADKGIYSRSIGGEDYDKQIFGKPLINEGSSVTDEHMQSVRESISEDPRNPLALNIQTGELMEIAFQLLKGRVSPEARAHKLEYDTKYESSPERVKYREDLNRERRRRGIYGAGDGKDVSHTAGGKLTLEGEHSNRARHFKNRGTLRPVAVKKAKQTTLPEFTSETIRDAHSESRLPSLTLGTKPGSDPIDRRQVEELSNRMLAELGKLNLSSIISAEGGSKEYGNEPSFTIPNVTPEQEVKLRELAKVYGQKEIMYTGGQDKPSFKDPEGNVTQQYDDSRITADKPEYFTNYPGSDLYQTLN